ncbi:methyl-accepting chemotaxis protein [Marinilactibacillus sp. 15R]|uniref:methyl-accepting chemotaxis protein n=1 Tax=Marinilactibacillus sp. 15R TaxID=1911586 RepID=UPI0009F9A4F4|nr:methyl-accepting chemotaxis protein [Marinilactibacillus sp. 15R]
MDRQVKQEEKENRVKNKSRRIPLLQFKSLRAKILFGFSLVIIFIIALMIETSISTFHTNKETESMVAHEIPLMIADERVGFSVARRSTNVRAYLMTGDEKYRDMFEETAEAVQPYIETLGELSNSDTVDELIATHEEWTQSMLRDVFEVYAAGNETEALANMDVLAPTTTFMLDTLAESARNQEEIIEDSGENIMEIGQTGLLLNLIVSTVVIILAVFIALLTSRSISIPVKKVMERMNDIKEGNLKNEYLTITNKDETGQLADSANTMQDHLKDILSNVSEVSYLLSYNSKELSETSAEVMAGTDQVAMTMQELSEGSETQANTASKLSAIMDDFSQKVSATNKNGQHINTLSDKVLKETANGITLMESSENQMMKINDIVKQSVEKVDKLDMQTQEISKLVEIIQNVANQTNLLALNAAIEAARAGEHGKGFAVVADEVRKLAEQVDVSVSEITGFVQTIQLESKGVSDSLQEGYAEVQTGTSQIKATGDTFKQISKSLNDVAQNIQGINTNLSELQHNTDEMNASIEEVASVSEESAAGVEETSAATQQINSSMEEIAGEGGKISQLVELAQNMDNLLKGFKI